MTKRKTVAQVAKERAKRLGSDHYRKIVAKRWEKTTREERVEHAQKMVRAKAAKAVDNLAE